MNESITLTIGQSERAELESLLEQWNREFQQGEEEHERIQARIESDRRAIKHYRELLRANLEKPCGKL
ncbi:MAG: hypothetical protein AAB401_06585 [Acidobacteriota bacterium]